MGLLIAALLSVLLVQGERGDLWPSEDVRGEHVFEVRIAPDSPPHRFVVVGTDDNYLDEIRVFPPDATEPRQVLQVDSVEPPFDGAEWFSAIDFNADGYLDLRVMTWWGATGNQGYAVWLFEPELRSFGLAEEYSKLSNPVPDGMGCVSTHAVGGRAGRIYRDARYCRVDGELVAVEEERQDWDDVRKCFLRTHSVLQEGKLVALKREVVCDPHWQ